MDEEEEWHEDGRSSDWQGGIQTAMAAASAWAALTLACPPHWRRSLWAYETAPADFVLPMQGDAGLERSSLMVRAAVIVISISFPPWADSNDEVLCTVSALASIQPALGVPVHDVSADRA